MIDAIPRGMMVKEGSAEGKRLVASSLCDLVASSLCDYAMLERVESEWRELVNAARLGSPFAHPGWSMTWAKRFVPENDLQYVAIRHGGDHGRLVRLAPYYRKRRMMAGTVITTIQAVGTGQGDPLTEGCHLVALPGRARDVLSVVVKHLAALPDTDWIQLAVGDGQPKPITQWIDGDTGWVIHHRKVRPCVVIDDMPREPEQFLSGLGRNLRESPRRARNRSAHLGAMEFRRVSHPDEIVTAVHHLIRLHIMRSEMAQKIQHGENLGGAFDEFLVEAASQLAREGLASVFLAEHADSPVAAQLVLSDGSPDYISVSGLDLGSIGTRI